MGKKEDKLNKNNHIERYTKGSEIKTSPWAQKNNNQEQDLSIKKRMDTKCESQNKTIT